MTIKDVVRHPLVIKIIKAFNKNIDDKIDVIVKDKNWLKFIKNPDKYLKGKLKNSKNKFFGKNKYNLTIQLSGSKEIKLLNKKFRKKNYSTDILSFPNQTKKNLRNY